MNSVFSVMRNCHANLELCYTFINMDNNRHIWDVWAKFLHQWGVQNITVNLLESLGSLAVLGAQVVYLGQPLFGSAGAGSHLTALASMLEDTHERHAFVDYLREVDQS